MADQRLEEYRKYYDARAERYANNPNHIHSYEAEKRLRDVFFQYDTFEEIRDHFGTLNIDCAFALWRDQYEMESRFYESIEEPVRKKGAERARKYDVVLFKRPPDKYVLHRVVKVRPEGYDILGDNCASRERNVPEARVLGVLTSFVHKGKEHSAEEKGYKLYSRLAVAGQPLRILRAKAAGVLRRVRKLFRKRKNEKGE